MNKLYRSRKNQVIGGVCAGIGNYFNIDPVLIRLIWLVLFLAGGVGLVAYIVAWIIVPLEESTPRDNPPVVTENPRRASNAHVLGTILVVLGAMLLLREFWRYDDHIRYLIRMIWHYCIPVSYTHLTLPTIYSV